MRARARVMAMAAAMAVVAAGTAVLGGVGGLGPVAAAAAPRPTTVYAHRGGAGLAPENTLGAFRQTWAQFADRGVWLELDTQLTADGQLVVLHDDTLDRTTTCHGPVIHVTLAGLAACDASRSFPGWGHFEAVPALRDVLTEGRDAGWRLMIEIKNIPGEANFDLLGTAVADALVTLVRQTGFPLDRLLVQSFWPLSLDRVEAELPRVGTVFLTASSLPGLSGIGIPVIVNALYGFLRGYEITSPDSGSLDMNATIVALAHLLGRRVVPYTPDTPAEIHRMLAMGVDGVISNYPDRVYAQLG